MATPPPGVTACARNIGRNQECSSDTSTVDDAAASRTIQDVAYPCWATGEACAAPATALTRKSSSTHARESDAAGRVSHTHCASAAVRVATGHRPPRGTPSDASPIEKGSRVSPPADLASRAVSWEDSLDSLTRSTLRVNASRVPADHATCKVLVRALHARVDDVHAHARARQVAIVEDAIDRAAVGVNAIDAPRRAHLHAQPAAHLVVHLVVQARRVASAS